MSEQRRLWMPAGVLVLGALASTLIGAQQHLDLRSPLEDAILPTVLDMPGADVEVSDEEAAVAGFDDYAIRLYEPEGAGPGDQWASVYLGYYGSQTQGRTIHSPQNCLPGAGWEVLSSQAADIGSGDDAFTVNRYMLKNGQTHALVLYWYQGRGRVEHDEYRVKWDLLRDAALQRRTDEALVRIVVPVRTTEEAAYERAREIAETLKPRVDRVLPAA